MIQLHDKQSGDVLGEINEVQLQFLIDELVEEDDKDKDYYIDGPTLEMLESAGADTELLGVLRSALGDRSGMEIEWKRV